MELDMVKVLTLTLAVICTNLGVSAWYYCHGDLCDEKTEFCSDDFQKCRPCREVLDDCLTNRLPKNCTRVCIQDKFEEQMEKEKERKCAEPKPLLNGYLNGSQKALYDQGDVISVSCNPGFRLAEITCPYPSIIRNGFWTSRNPNVTHVAGDKIEAVCNQGYLMNGNANWNCSNDGNWISSDSYFPLCHLPGETEVVHWLIMTLAILFFISFCINIALAICLTREMRKQKRKKKQHNKCKEIAVLDTNENSRLLESKNDTAGSVSLRDQKGKKETTSLTRPDLPDQNVSPMQCNPEEPQQNRRTSEDNVTHRPDTLPQTDHTEDGLPLQRESSIENINENGHYTFLKTYREDTGHESNYDQNLRFPEQQAGNNEQDCDRKMAISSNDTTINLDDIALRKFGPVGQ